MTSHATSLPAPRVKVSVGRKNDLINVLQM